MQLGIRPGPIEDIRPYQVEGFRAAWEAGHLPVVPAAPPPLLPGTSADSLFWQYARRTGVGVLAHIVVVDQVVPRVPGALGFALMLGGGLGLFWYAFIRSLRMTGLRNLEELDNGYTTFTMVIGDFFVGGRSFPGRPSRMPWDYAGVWLLHRRTGAVLAEPQRWLEPPGYYPSPSRPGWYELWTGNAWSGHYRPLPGGISAGAAERSAPATDEPRS